MRELSQSRNENTRTRHLVEDLMLDRHVLQEVIRKTDPDQAAGYRTMGTGLH